MMDFTNCEEVICDYSGSEKKKKIIYNNEYHLLKFPDPNKNNEKTIYKNNVFGTYIGCKIFKLLDIPVQEVLLGEYKENEESSTILKKKIVVACKDFTSPNNKLIEFSSLANSITNSDKHFSTDIVDVYSVLDNINLKYDKDKVIESFWNMFVVDTLIGNIDRHLSNWGLLSGENNIYFSPVYDCGSSLHPLMSDEDMERYLNNKVEFKEKVYNIYPVYKYNNEKITYKQFYKKNIKELNEAVKRIVPKINIKKINNIIDSVSPMSETRKEFLKQSINYRKENILDPAYKKLN